MGSYLSLAWQEVEDEAANDQIRNIVIETAAPEQTSKQATRNSVDKDVEEAGDSRRSIVVETAAPEETSEQASARNSEEKDAEEAGDSSEVWFSAKHNIEVHVERGEFSEFDEGIDHEVSKWYDPSSHFMFTVYDEATDMLAASIMAYGGAQLRELAREGLLKSCEEDPDALRRIEELPHSYYDVMRVYYANRDVIRTALKNDEETLQMYYDAMTSKTFTNPGAEEEELEKQAMVVAFGDFKCEEECVFGITVNPKRRRITLAFRGSVTQQDWQKDAKIFMGEVPNPVKMEKQAKQVGVHQGFKEYLYSDRDYKWHETFWQHNKQNFMHHTYENHNALPPEKFKVILDLVSSYCEKHPGYFLYVTGHSLGGALATLLGFEAAASTDSRIPKPVTVVSVASPKVGNLQFRKAFEALEKSRKLRCLRVSNELDVVTLGPSLGLLGILDPIFCRHLVFRHVGLQLALRDQRCCDWRARYHLKYPPMSHDGLTGFLFDRVRLLVHDIWTIIASTALVFTMCCGLFACALSGVEAAKQHSCSEYSDRLHANKHMLQKIFLNDLYNEKVKRGLYPASPNLGTGRLRTLMSTKRLVSKRRNRR